MKLHAVGVGSYKLHQPEICDCFISLVFAEDITQARIKGRRMCDKYYSYDKGWDQAGDVVIEPLEQGLQIGEYVLHYSASMISTDPVSKPNLDPVPRSDTPSVYVAAISSHYWWGQDEYPACLLSFIVASEAVEAKKLAAESKGKLFSTADGDWTDSYAVAALRLTDMIAVENHSIYWAITKA
jgi:hypothetical protein